tara:strand:+ start:192 stop:602 length:411 start_codon:yes stop_codon:yes gene_type:complete
MAQVNLDTAARLDIICRKGDTFQLDVDFGSTLSDTTLANWKMQIATSDTASATQTIEGESSSGSNGFLIADNDDGTSNAKLTVIINSTTMAGISSGLYVYDIQSDGNTAGSTGGSVKTHLYGTFKVNEDITVPGVA